MLQEWQMWAHDWNRIKAEACADIIAKAKDFAVHEATAGGRVDRTIRNADVRWLPPGLFPWLQDLLWQRAAEANRAAFGFDFNFLPELQFTHYYEGRRGHYDWHQDVFFVGDPVPKTTHRKISCVIQLSDPETYEGGDLELDLSMRPPRDELRKRGTMVLFPSFLHHRVTPVTKGERFSLVCWFEGPKWR